METILKVDGMSCSHCEARVNKALAAIGVESNVDLETKEVTVQHDATITTEQLIAAIDDAGYDAVVK